MYDHEKRGHIFKAHSSRSDMCKSSSRLCRTSSLRGGAVMPIILPMDGEMCGQIEIGRGSPAAFIEDELDPMRRADTAILGAAGEQIGRIAASPMCSITHRRAGLARPPTPRSSAHRPLSAAGPLASDCAGVADDCANPAPAARRTVRSAARSAALLVRGTIAFGDSRTAAVRLEPMRTRR